MSLPQTMMAARVRLAGIAARRSTGRTNLKLSVSQDLLLIMLDTDKVRYYTSSALIVETEDGVVYVRKPGAKP